MELEGLTSTVFWVTAHCDFEFLSSNPKI